MEYSLGLVEVSALGNAIIMLDDMLKAADVEFVATERKLGGRLVTIVVRGELTSVQASVDAGVARAKVFPHNLRHLFARTFYSLQKDIVRLADILGHSSINTTRIYTMETGEIHRRQIQKLGLLRC